MKDYKKVFTFLALLIILILLYFFNPITSIYAPKCPIKLIFNINCPSCGIQRAIHALLQGHFAEAFRYNYYLILAFPYAGLILINYLFFTGKIKEHCSKIIENKNVVRFYVVIYFLWFVFRNIYKI